MYLFMIEATPGPDVELGEEGEGQSIGGAYVNCWIDYKNYEGAEHLAVFYIKNQGWIPGEIVEAYEIEKKGDRGDDAARIAEAEETGYCVLFNCYPPDTEYDIEEGSSVV